MADIRFSSVPPLQTLRQFVGATLRFPSGKSVTITDWTTDLVIIDGNLPLQYDGRMSRYQIVPPGEVPITFSAIAVQRGLTNVTVIEKSCYDSGPKTILLHELLASIPAEYTNMASIKIENHSHSDYDGDDHYDDSYWTTLSVTYERPETDHEMGQRLGRLCCQHEAA